MTTPRFTEHDVHIFIALCRVLLDEMKLTQSNLIRAGAPSRTLNGIQDDISACRRMLQILGTGLEKSQSSLKETNDGSSGN